LDRSENDRRIAAVIQVALGASLGVYTLLLVFLRRSLEREPREGTGLFLALAAIGIAQFLAVSAIGRKTLASGRGDPVGRVRSYFLIRGAAAEALGIFGLTIGMMGTPLGQALALIAMGAVGLAAAAPTRGAWEEALRLAEGLP
jgi:hypothetical protein